ncbi:MAG: hypothetical protein ACOC04_05890 [Halothece sp.]
MDVISQLVEEAIHSGYLTIEAEDKLRQLLRQKYSQADFEAFMLLQQAAMSGKVKQQSRELLFS